MMRNGGCVLPDTREFEKLFKLGVGAQILVRIQVAAHVMRIVTGHTSAPHTGIIQPNKSSLVVAETMGLVQ